MVMNLYGTRRGRRSFEERFAGVCTLIGAGVDNTSNCRRARILLEALCPSLR